MLLAVGARLNDRAGAGVSVTRRLEFDQIVPVSRSGANTDRNIELRCETCNRKKRATI
jgi:5-methylcytosine-specific restriction endonuclease McrA